MVDDANGGASGNRDLLRGGTENRVGVGSVAPLKCLLYSTEWSCNGKIKGN